MGFRVVTKADIAYVPRGEIVLTLNRRHKEAALTAVSGQLLNLSRDEKGKRVTILFDAETVEFAIIKDTQGEHHASFSSEGSLGCRVTSLYRAIERYVPKAEFEQREVTKLKGESRYLTLSSGGVTKAHLGIVFPWPPARPSVVDEEPTDEELAEIEDEANELREAEEATTKDSLVVHTSSPADGPGATCQESRQVQIGSAAGKSVSVTILAQDTDSPAPIQSEIPVDAVVYPELCIPDIREPKPKKVSARTTPIEWAPVRKAYETSDAAPTELAERFGVSLQTLRDRVKRESWRRPSKPVAPLKINAPGVQARRQELPEQPVQANIDRGPTKPRGPVETGFENIPKVIAPPRRRVCRESRFRQPDWAPHPPTASEPGGEDPGISRHRRRRFAAGNGSRSPHGPRRNRLDEGGV